MRKSCNKLNSSSPLFCLRKEDQHTVHKGDVKGSNAHWCASQAPTNFTLQLVASHRSLCVTVLNIVRFVSRVSYEEPVFSVSSLGLT